MKGALEGSRMDEVHLGQWPLLDLSALFPHAVSGRMSSTEWSMHILDAFLKFSNSVILMTFKCLRQGHSRQEVAPGQSLRINVSKAILVLCCLLY